MFMNKTNKISDWLYPLSIHWHLLIWWPRFPQLIWWSWFRWFCAHYLWHIKFSMLHIQLPFILYRQWQRVIPWQHLPFSSFKHPISFRLRSNCFRHWFFQLISCFFIQRVRWWFIRSRFRLRFQLLSHQWWIIQGRISIQRFSLRCFRVSQLRRLRRVKRGQGWGSLHRFLIIQRGRQRHQLRVRWHRVYPQ